MSLWRVSYGGFLGPIARDFQTCEVAECWARAVGVFGRAKIKEINTAREGHNKGAA